MLLILPKPYLKNKRIIKMKKLLSILIVISMVMVLVSCTDKKVDNPTGMTPEETVQKYFDYWQEKNPAGMDSLVYEKMQGAEAGLDQLNSVELTACQERTEKENWNDLWYENPYDYTCVDVSFTIDYQNGGAAGFSNGRYNWQYYLVKESENSDWIIVMWGVG